MLLKMGLAKKLRFSCVIIVFDCKQKTCTYELSPGRLLKKYFTSNVKVSSKTGLLVFLRTLVLRVSILPLVSRTAIRANGSQQPLLRVKSLHSLNLTHNLSAPLSTFSSNLTSRCTFP